MESSLDSESRETMSKIFNKHIAVFDHFVKNIACFI